MDIDFTTLGIFIAASVALYISPGPDMIYVASRSIGQGRRAGIVSCLGVQTGLIIHMLAASFGLAALLAQFPDAFEIIRWIGIGYLVFLGARTLLDRNADFSLDRKKLSSGWSDRKLYLQGLFVNLLNPKIAIFFLAFLPQFVDPARGDVSLQMLFYGVVFNLGGFPWILLMAILFGAAGNWLSARPQMVSAQKWITGSSLLGLALFMAIQDAPQRR